MDSSWKLESSTTATSSSRISSMMGSSARPMLPAFMYPETGVCQEFGDQCGSRGLSVRTGHSVDLAGAECEKGFHFRSDNNALFACLLQFFVVIVHTRRPEYHIIIGQCIQIAVTQANFTPSA